MEAYATYLIKYSGPLIWQTASAETMNASVDDYVTPGDLINHSGLEFGHGIKIADKGPIALIAGKLISRGGKISISPSSEEPLYPELGDIAIGQVSRLSEKVAEIMLLHIESKDNGHKSLPAERLSADIYVSEMVDRFIPSAGDAVRIRDIVRVKITQTEPNLKATMKGSTSLGVLHAQCPPCGNELKSSDKKIDFNVSCNRCNYSGFRALSTGFGHGYKIPKNSQLHKLNREGERWSKDAESVLGHDGVRPYLSPLADFRRGLNHRNPINTHSRNPNKGPKNNRKMYPAKCTLCGDSTEVPFEPTLGKPLRCRDCLTKIQSGTATKTELSKEREKLNSARDKLQKTRGVKLFVGGISYDVSEEELVKLFSNYGKLKDVHLVMDRETNKSKGFAFVTFSRKKDANKAVRELQGYDLKGRKITVKESDSNARRNR